MPSRNTEDTMLVLSRRTDETIRVGDITITVVRIESDKVRIGIDAPRSIPISRPDCIRKTPKPSTP
jgi:carbon storage regulator